ncbi:MAG: DUF2333 family protein [Woeseiaceae bacterium]|nr:DUF2333 family protein [Woeseiaceae bacterium]
MRWPAFLRRKSGGTASPRPLWQKLAAGGALALVLLWTALGWYWSRTPDVFWVNTKPGGETSVVGFATTDTLIRVAETLLDKPGGYLTNDIMPPGVVLETCPTGSSGCCNRYG